jgi:F-type H+-transporting ATPase subunit epsilon
MPDSFHCSLVTPERSVLEAEVTYADVPAHDGQMGFAHGRAAILLELGIGRLTLNLADGGTAAYVLDGGFGQMRDNRLTLLCERAWSPDDLSAQDAQAMLGEAEALPMNDTEQVDQRTHDLAVANQLVSLVG